MKTATWLKVGVLVAVAACTWLVTSTIIAGTPRHKKNRGVIAGSSVQQERPIENGKRRPLPGEILPAGRQANVTASYEFTSLSVRPGQEWVTIDAAVTITDKNGSLPLMWAVVVRQKATGSEVKVIPYDRQIFTAKAGETRRATFNDAVPVPPGTYEVELRLYRIMPDANAATLIQGQARNQRLLLSRLRTVTVGE